MSVLLFYARSTGVVLNKFLHFVPVLVWRLECKSKNDLNKVVNVCGKVMGERQEHLSQLYERRVVRKARVIVNDNSHVLAKYYELRPCGRPFRVPKSNTVQSIAFLNR